MIGRLLIVLIAALASGSCLRRPPLLPGRGVDVDVHVHVGADALRGAAPAPCRCCPAPPAACTCRSHEARRSR